MLTKDEKIELEELLTEAKKYIDNKSIFESLESKEDKVNYLNEFSKLSNRLMALRLKEADLMREYSLSNGAKIIAMKDSDMDRYIQEGNQ